MLVVLWRLSVFAALLAGNKATSVTTVTPIEKVITLLDELKAEVVADGSREATAYDEFACFCKSQTKTKSDSITSGADQIEQFSTEIAQKTAEQVLKQTEVQQLKADLETSTKELQEETVNYEKQKLEYEARAADMTKAISSLNGAINAMAKQKENLERAGLPGFLELRKTVAQSLALADAMSVISQPERKAINAFLQEKVDPSDPNYKYHSQDIVNELDKLLGQFTQEKKELDSDWKNTSDAFNLLSSALSGKISGLKADIKSGESRIDTLASEIGAAKENLVTTQSVLQDDKLYLKDLTAKCESTAKDWDQQSSMRSDEIAALTDAIDILKNKVTPAEVVNVRALLQSKPADVKSVRRVLQVAKRHSDKKAASNAAAPSVREAVSLVQTRRSNTFLKARRTSVQQRKDRAAAILREAGQQLGSPALSALAVQIAADPFKKVKGLIEKLIERLIAESTAEATKKGYCDTELAKARKNRDYRFAEARRKNVDAAALEVKKDELTQEIESLGTIKIPQMQEALKAATELRANETKANSETLATAEQGLKDITEAISILKTFYGKAAKATVLLQKESPINEDMKALTTTEGAYQGKQKQSVAIISLLEQIKDDFERTFRKTTAEEQKAAADFVELERSSKSSLSGWETKKALDEEDLETTNTDLKKTMSDFSFAMDLVDEALKAIEALKPTCIDSGMSYKDRVAKREEEIAALKNAVCALDTDGVESDCPAAP